MDKAKALQQVKDLKKVPQWMSMFKELERNFKNVIENELKEIPTRQHLTFRIEEKVRKEL